MSSETKWTRGDWKVATRGCEGFAVAQVDGVQNVAHFMTEADAQLLVGARKLYEALYQVLTVANLRDHPAIAEMARTALASARGEG